MTSSPPKRKPIKLSADHLAAMARVRGMIEARQGLVGLVGAARDLAKSYGVNPAKARQMLESPERLNLHELSLLMTWLGWRIQFVEVTQPPPLDGPAPQPAKPSRKSRKIPQLGLEDWKAWVEENRRKDTAKDPFRASPPP